MGGCACFGNLFTVFDFCQSPDSVLCIAVHRDPEWWRLEPRTLDLSQRTGGCCTSVPAEGISDQTAVTTVSVCMVWVGRCLTSDGRSCSS